MISELISINPMPGRISRVLCTLQDKTLMAGLWPDPVCPYQICDWIVGPEAEAASPGHIRRDI